MNSGRTFRARLFGISIRQRNPSLDIAGFKRTGIPFDHNEFDFYQFEKIHIIEETGRIFVKIGSNVLWEVMNFGTENAKFNRIVLSQRDPLNRSIYPMDANEIKKFVAAITKELHPRVADEILTSTNLSPDVTRMISDYVVGEIPRNRIR